MTTFEQEYARINAECEAVRAQIEQQHANMHNNVVNQQIVNHINQQLMVNQQMELAQQLHMQHIHTCGM